MKSKFIIFSKAPRLGYSKSRLARTIGAIKTLEISQLMLSHSFLSISELDVENKELIWSISDKSEVSYKLWADKNLIIQKGDGLAQRLSYVWNRSFKSGDIVFFMGSDLPHFNIEKLSASINDFCNSSASVFIGPALDGGFYIIGSKVDIEEEFKGITYSDKNTFNSLFTKLSLKYEVMSAHKEFDLDEEEDLIRIIKNNKDYYTESQSKFVNQVARLMD